MKRCHKCLSSWEGVGQPAPRETCLECSEDLHVCLNCRFYDAHKPDQCQLDNLEPVLYKGKANFCEEFQFINNDPRSINTRETLDKARDQWKKLFKK